MKKYADNSPVECLGYSEKCCFVIPLEAAAITICVVTYIKSICEILVSLKLLQRTPLEESLQWWFLFMYLGVALCYGFINSYLAFGIIARRELTLYRYMWITFLLKILSMILSIFYATVFIVIKIEETDLSHFLILTAFIAWDIAWLDVDQALMVQPDCIKEHT